MQICNHCGWIGPLKECTETDGATTCPLCHGYTRQGRTHDYDDEAVCTVCGLDGAEASYYAHRGYAGEYPTLHDCPGRRA